MSGNFDKLEHFIRLQKEQENYMQLCIQKINNWQKFKDDYLTLKSRLDILPHELRYQVTVPVSKVAFMQGRLINTNEILVLLGDNWFVEKSAKQACDVIDRRLKNIDSFLQDLDKEKKNLTEQINWTQNLLKEKGQYVNIEEKYEEIKTNLPKKSLSQEEKKELRRKLQEKALKTSLEIESEMKQDLKSLYRSTSVAEPIEEEDEEENLDDGSSSENFMLKLESDIKELDSGQKFDQEDNLRDLMEQYDRGIDRENNLKIEKKLKKQVKWSDNKTESETVEILEEEEEDDEFSETESSGTEEESSKSVEPIRIQIKHTTDESTKEQDRKLKFSRDKPEINSPADIYNTFYKPKSILKKTASFNSQQQSLEPECVKTEAKNANMEKFEPLKAFTGEIVEKNVSVILSEKSELERTKPVSKFKASKFSQNK